MGVASGERPSWASAPRATQCAHTGAFAQGLVETAVRETFKRTLYIMETLSKKHTFRTYLI